MTDEPTVTVTSVYAARHAEPSLGRPAPSNPTSQCVAALLAGLAVAGWWFGLFVSAYFIPFFDFRIGRVAVGCAAAAGVLAAMLNVPLTKRLPKFVSVGVALYGGALFVMVTTPIVPPAYFAMRAELKTLSPPRWRVLDDFQGGNSICFDECTSIERIFQPPTTKDADTDEFMTSLLKQHGYHQSERTYSGARVFRKGHFEVTSYADRGVEPSPGYAGRPPGWTLAISAT